MPRIKTIQAPTPRQENRKGAGQALLDRFLVYIDQIEKKFIDPRDLDLLQTLEVARDLNEFQAAFLRTELSVACRLGALNVFFTLLKMVLKLFVDHKPDEAKAQEWALMQNVILAGFATSVEKMLGVFSAAYMDASWLSGSKRERERVSERVKLANTEVIKGANLILTRLRLMRWPAAEGLSSLPNWQQLDLERLYAMVAVILNFTPLVELESDPRSQAIQKLAKDWESSLSVGHAQFLQRFFPELFTQEVLDDLKLSDDIFGVAQAPEDFSKPELGGFDDQLFQGLEKSVTQIFAASSDKMAFLVLLSSIFASSEAAKKFVAEQTEKMEKRAKEYALLLEEELAAEEQRRSLRYQRRSQKRKQSDAKEEAEPQEALKNAEQEDQPSSPRVVELSKVLEELHELMLNASIGVNDKIERINRILGRPNLSEQERLELQMVRAELILKQDVKPAELEEQIASLTPFTEKNAWVLDLIAELEHKLEELNEARARVKERGKHKPPQKQEFVLIPPEVKAILSCLERFWGKAYVMGDFPRNFFAKIESNSHIDNMVVLGCPRDFFKRPEYQALLAQQLREKLKKPVELKLVAEFDRLLRITIGDTVHDVWFSKEKFLGRQLRDFGLYCDTICVDKNGRALSFFSQAIPDAKNKKCRPVQNWELFFQDPAQYLQLLALTELDGFGFETKEDEEIVFAKFKEVRAFDAPRRAEWLKENPVGFQIFLGLLLRAALLRYLKSGEAKPLLNIIRKLGSELILEQAHDFLRFSSFVAFIKDQQALEAMAQRAQSSKKSYSAAASSSGQRLFSAGAQAANAKQPAHAQSPAPS